MKEHTRLVVMLLLGAVIGSGLNTLLVAAGAPDWLVRVLPMGFDPPFSVDLLVGQLTFGLTVNLSFLTIAGMVGALAWFRSKL